MKKQIAQNNSNIAWENMYEERKRLQQELDSKSDLYIKALEALIKDNYKNEQALIEALYLLVRLTSNITKHPDDQRFRSINKGIAKIN